MISVKICGVTRAEDARAAIDAGASAIGFVFWPSSPRFIEPEAARRLLAGLPPLVTAVGIFVDQPIEHVRAVRDRVGLGAVQLHGAETPDYCRRLESRVIKALPLTPDVDPETVGEAYPATTLLLDAHDPERFGGTGRTVDWDMAARIAARRRVILSGGLDPANVRRAIETVRPYGVDVSSGVEARPGIKDAERVRAFLRAVADARSVVDP